MDCITDSENSPKIMDSVSSVKSLNQIGGDINDDMLISDRILTKLKQISKTTMYMKGGNFKRTFNHTHQLSPNKNNLSISSNSSKLNNDMNHSEQNSTESLHKKNVSHPSEQNSSEQNSSEHGDKSNENDSISSLSSATSTSLGTIQSGGAKHKRKSKGNKIKTDIYEHGVYSIKNGEYILSDSDLFTITG